MVFLSKTYGKPWGIAQATYTTFALVHLTSIPMKTLLITLSVLLISLAGSAQNLEQTFAKLMDEYKKSPSDFAKNYYSDDYRFVGPPSGKFTDKNTMVRSLAPLNVTELTYSDVKFFESGSLGVVSGYITIKYAVNTYKDAFTYTFQKRDGKWLNVSAQHTEVAYNRPNEVANTIETFKTYFETSRLAFLANPVKFFDEECTPDFQYVTSKGSIVSLPIIRNSFLPKKVLQRDITQLVCKLYGTTMMVTAQMTHKYQNTQDNVLTDYGTETVTYMYVKTANGWKLASAHHSKGE